MDLRPHGSVRRQLLVLLLAVAVPGAARAQRGNKMSMEDEVRVLAQLKGPHYRTLRDALLSRNAGQADLIARYRGDPDWRVSTVAAILQGWTERRPLYTKVLAEVDAVNPAVRSKRNTGMVGIWEEFEMRAHLEFGPSVLPLAWEQMIMLADGAPPWRTATWLAMISGVPLAESVEPVVHLIETTEEKLLLDRAAMTLSRLPREAVDSRLERLSAKAAAISAAVSSARELRR